MTTPAVHLCRFTITTYPALIFLRTYPAVPLLFFYALTLLCLYPALRLPLTLGTPAKISGVPAITCRTFRGVHVLMLVRGTLLTRRVRSGQAVFLFFFALTLPCPYFSSYLPCCVLIFLRTYLAVRLSRFTINTTNYPAVP